MISKKDLEIRKKQIRERIQKIRKIRKLSNQQLGGKLGVTGANISLVENGMRGLSLDWIIKLAEALNCTIPQLLAIDPIEEEHNIDGNTYSIDRNYMEYALEIAENIEGIDKLDKKEKSKLISELYNLVYDFFKKNPQTSNKELIAKKKKEVAVNNAFIKFLEQNK